MSIMNSVKSYVAEILVGYGQIIEIENRTWHI